MEFTTMENGMIECNEGNHHSYTLSYCNCIVKIEVDGKHDIEARGPGTLCQNIRKAGMKPPESLTVWSTEGLNALWAITDYKPVSIAEFSESEILNAIKENVSEKFLEPTTSLFMAMKRGEYLDE